MNLSRGLGREGDRREGAKGRRTWKIGEGGKIRGREEIGRGGWRKGNLKGSETWWNRREGRGEKREVRVERRRERGRRGGVLCN